MKEDADCKVPYSASSNAPSFVAKTGECKMWYKGDKAGNVKSYYVKLTIEASSTSGSDAP